MTRQACARPKIKKIRTFLLKKNRTDLSYIWSPFRTHMLKPRENALRDRDLRTGALRHRRMKHDRRAMDERGNLVARGPQPVATPLHRSVASKPSKTSRPEACRDSGPAEHVHLAGRHLGVESPYPSTAA